jgi:5,10-methylene-tetrahydrofolate dehydrogenase/methenyl tetrahydrofolate cyclohydrolase
MLIDDKKIDGEVRSRLASEVATSAVTPGLATILVGDDPAGAWIRR